MSHHRPWWHRRPSSPTETNAFPDLDLRPLSPTRPWWEVGFLVPYTCDLDYLWSTWHAALRRPNLYPRLVKGILGAVNKNWITLIHHETSLPLFVGYKQQILLVVSYAPHQRKKMNRIEFNKRRSAPLHGCSLHDIIVSPSPWVSNLNSGEGASPFLNSTQRKLYSPHPTSLIGNGNSTSSKLRGPPSSRGVDSSKGSRIWVNSSLRGPEPSGFFAAKTPNCHKPSPSTLGLSGSNNTSASRVRGAGSSNGASPISKSHSTSMAVAPIHENQKIDGEFKVNIPVRFLKVKW